MDCVPEDSFVEQDIANLSLGLMKWQVSDELDLASCHQLLDNPIRYQGGLSFFHCHTRPTG